MSMQRSQKALFSAVLARDIQGLGDAISAGADVNARDRDGRTALMHAVINQDPESIKLLLKQYKADPNVRDRSGWSALHFAAQSGAREIVRELVEAGAVVDSADEHGNTPLFRAVFAYRGTAEAVTSLLELGADPDHLNRHGMSPRKLAHNIGNYDTKKFFP